MKLCTQTHKRAHNSFAPLLDAHALGLSNIAEFSKITWSIIVNISYRQAQNKSPALQKDNINHDVRRTEGTRNLVLPI